MTVVDVILIMVAAGVAALALALGIVAVWRAMRPTDRIRLARRRH
jgi:hypothetical protein